MSSGICGLFKNTYSAKVARGEIKKNAEKTKTEAKSLKEQTKLIKSFENQTEDSE